MVVTQVEPRIVTEVEGKKAVICFSGGVDSTTLLYDIVSRGYKVYPIIFDYGQRHRREIESASNICLKLGVLGRIIELDALNELAPSVLTRENLEVPKVGYDIESMKQTVVPNRNMVFLSLAVSYAIGLGADQVFYAAHGGDHALYPDCRSEFVKSMQEVIRLCDWKGIQLEAPYLHWNKYAIIKRGFELGVDYSLTWSCYEGKDLACGECGTCRERLEAFKLAGVEDPIRYRRRL